MDLRTRYRRSLLGLGWSLLNPIAMTTIFCAVFHSTFAKDDSLFMYAAYLLAGLSCWQFMTGAVLQGCQCFYRGESYIRQYPAPLAIYPLRTALGCMVHFLLALSVVLLLAISLRGLDCFRYIWTLGPSLAILFIFGWGLAILAGFATVHFNDTQHLLEILFQILFYATPVMYKSALLSGHGLDLLVRLNPLLPFLDLIREPILLDHAPSLHTVGSALLLTASVSLTAIVMLNRLGKRLIFHL